MEGFLVQLGTMSLQAAIIILIVCVIRALFMKGRIPQKYIMLLWMIPFFFMVFPWKISSPVGFWRESTVVSQQRTWQQEQNQTMGSSVMNTQNSHVIPNESLQTPDQALMQDAVTAPIRSANERLYSARDIMQMALFAVWVIGVLAVLCYMLVSTWKLKKKLVCSMCEQDNIYLAEDISLPMVFGVFKPRIYLPVSMDEEHRSYVLSHEQTHIMRRDPLKKLLAFLIVGVHWFNPLAWVAFILLERDMEMACDEETVKRLGEESKKAYASTLLWISAGRSAKAHRLGVPLAFGEVDTKQRIKNILTNKKTMQVVAIVVILVCVVLTTVFLTKREERVDKGSQTEEIIQVEDTVSEKSEAVIETEEEPQISMPQQIEIVVAKVTEDMVDGADGMLLVYADEERLICRDYNGLYVYDLKEQRMLRQIALEPIGCQYTQGDWFCEVYATLDGSKVYLHPQLTDELYIYDVEENALWKQNYDFKNSSLWVLSKSMEGISFFDGLLSRSEYIGNDFTVFQSALCVEIEEGSYGYLYGGSGMLMDTAWVVRDAKGQETFTYLFRENEVQTQEVSNAADLGEFTMDMLIEICDTETVQDVFQGLVWEDGLCYSNFSRTSSEYSLTWSYSCELFYAEKTYTLHLYYWKPETAKEYGEVPDGLNSVSIYDNKSGDGILLYDSEPERYTVNTDIREFLERRYDIGDYMTLELPKGVTLGDYQIYNNDIFNGCLMYGDYEETVHGEWTPQSWYALGGVGVLEAKDHPVLTFKNERLTDVIWLMNHGGLEGEGEYLEGCDMQAILFEAFFDTFTIPEWEEYKEKYPDASDEQSTSEYWYVFFGEPDGEMIYTVYLNQEHFTKEDMIALARSARFVKK